MNLRAMWVLGLCLCLAGPGVLAASAEERMAQDYLQALAAGRAERLLDFYHPDEITALRARVLKALEAEAAGNGDTLRRRAFGVAATMDAVRKLTPGNMFVQLTERTGLPQERVEKVQALGTIEENAQTLHVLARLSPPRDVPARSHLAVVTLLRHGKAWRVALPIQFQNQVDRLLQAGGEETNTDPPAPTAGNSDDINSLLETSVQLLTAGRCASYFNQQMSPRFRAKTSAQALQRLIAHCERSVDTRETYISALQIARTATPRYEDSGRRAVYDMTGKGLPFQRFVLEQVDRRWYIAE